MSFGIRLDNDGDKRVIGGDTVVPRFVGKFTTSSWTIDDNRGKQVTWSVTCPNMPLVFVHTNDGHIAFVKKITGSSPNWEVTVQLATSTSPSPSDVTAYIFSSGYTTGSTSGYGFQVKKSNGEYVFDSGYDQLQIKDVFTGVSRAGGSGNFTNISKPAFMSPLFGEGFTYFLIYYRWFYSPFFGWIPSNVDITHIYWADSILTSSGSFTIQDYFMTDTSGLTWNHPLSTTYYSQPTPDSAVLKNQYWQPWLDNAEYIWGPEGTYSLTDSCVGDPSATLSSYTPSHTMGVVPSSGTYDVFMIDGADYD